MCLLGTSGAVGNDENVLFYRRYSTDRSKYGDRNPLPPEDQDQVVVEM